VKLKIVILEDEKDLNYAISLILEAEEFRIYSYYTLKEFLQNFEKIDPDLILADITLPDGNFLEEMKKHPQRFERYKIIVMSSYTEIENIKKAFELGAEDFIKKPFDYEEIILRINKIFKPKKIIYIDDDIKYNYEEKLLIKKAKVINLTKRESDLLELFLNNEGKILSSDFIISHIWQEYVPKNTLNVLVKRLREKLGKKDLIINKRELGYIFRKGGE
jgi:DNA-binding response OmpR family regulator